MRSGNSRPTNISSHERLSPVVNNVTEQGLAIAFADRQKPKDQSQITFESLQVGDIFDRDIRRIMAILNGVEKQFNERRITSDFQTALLAAY